jgi:hypothetical protein
MGTIKVDTEKLLEFANKMLDLKEEFESMIKEISSIEDSLNSVEDVSTYSQKNELYLIEEMGYIISREFENLAEDLNYASKEYENADEVIKSSIGSMTIDMNLNTIGDSSDSGGNNASYLKRSLNQIAYGNYTDDVTLLGTGTQMGAGLLGIDLPADIRDLSADFVNWEWSWGYVGNTVLDAATFLPILGGLKYTDEVAKLTKNGDEIADSIKGMENVIKVSDEAIDGTIKAEKIVGTKHNAIKPTQDMVNREKVENYISKLREGEKIDPIEIVDVEGKGKFITEGHHRYVASKESGLPVDIKIKKDSGPTGMPDWSYVEWKEYISEEQFWGD